MGARLNRFASLIAILLLMGHAVMSTAAEAEASAERVTVPREGVPVYMQMSTTSIVVMQLKQGDVVEINPAGTTAEGKWCRVREVAISGRSGYVRCEDLRNGAPEVMEFVREYKKLLLTKEGATDLIVAADRGDIEKVKALLAHGADVNARTDQGRAALMFAAIAGHTEVARLLLAHGADVNAKGIWGETALWCAAAFGSPSLLVQLLLSAGGDVNAREQYLGSTALLAAFLFGNVTTDTVRVLLAAGADVHPRDILAETALMKAQQGRYADIVQLLKQAGAQE
ncbi:MAG: ankyrin repeat domain-containing protein [candidate division NC10 bacterium]|nr:hypothetical protein [candidate division NC10 bacterium]MCH7895864.1 ankyrin repeat domain-containing protein [candidate division NC10 bacterium]